jgi:hypothetical protein
MRRRRPGDAGMAAITTLIVNAQGSDRGELLHHREGRPARIEQARRHSLFRT